MESFIIISIIFVILAVIILMGKGDFLIAGYNTASKEDKKKVNIKRLRLVIAGILILVPLIIGIPFFMGKEDNATAEIIAAIIGIIIAFAGIILANTWCLKK